MKITFNEKLTIMPKNSLLYKNEDESKYYTEIINDWEFSLKQNHKSLTIIHHIKMMIINFRKNKILANIAKVIKNNLKLKTRLKLKY